MPTQLRSSMGRRSCGHDEVGEGWTHDLAAPWPEPRRCDSRPEARSLVKSLRRFHKG